MKKILLFLTLTLSGLALGHQLQAQSPTVPQGTASPKTSLAIGSAMPLADKALHDVVTGRQISPNKLKQSAGTLVIFSCNTCPYVVKAQPRTREVLKLAEQLKIGVVILNSNEAQRNDADSEDAMKAYARQHGYAHYLVDLGDLADAFGATRTPEVFLFNAENQLVYKGAMDDNPANPEEVKQLYLANAMNAMVSKQTIDPTSSRSVGCSIKRK